MKHVILYLILTLGVATTLSQASSVKIESGSIVTLRSGH